MSRANKMAKIYEAMRTVATTSTSDPAAAVTESIFAVPVAVTSTEAFPATSIEFITES